MHVCMCACCMEQVRTYSMYMGTGVYVCTICIELVPIHDFLPMHPPN